MAKHISSTVFYIVTPGVYPGFTIGGFLVVARVARAKNLATTPTFRPRPLINDRLLSKMAIVCLILDDFSRETQGKAQEEEI